MKHLLLVIIMLGVSNCALINVYKKYQVSKIVEAIPEKAQEYMGCRTGLPVSKDVEKVLYKALKIPSTDRSPSAEDVAASPDVQDKYIATSVCAAIVSAGMPFLIGFGSAQLPQSWKDDDCGLGQHVDAATMLAISLCPG